LAVHFQKSPSADGSGPARAIARHRQPQWAAEYNNFMTLGCKSRQRPAGAR
jgi:hypothetical protein